MMEKQLPTCLQNQPSELAFSPLEKRLVEYIEHLTVINCETPRRPYLRGYNPHEKCVILFQPSCKLWGCKFCGEVNRKFWSIRAAHGTGELIEMNHKLQFVTLTSHRKLKTTQATEKAFRHGWDMLNKRIKRIAPHTEYIGVPEQHSDGRLHFHMITTAGLNKRWYKDNAASCGLGFIVDVQDCYSIGGAYHYMIDYIGKNLETTDWSKGFRRVRTSQKFPKLPQPNKAVGWIFDKVPKEESLREIVETFEARGYTVLLLDHKTAWQLVERTQFYLNHVKGLIH